MKMKDIKDKSDKELAEVVADSRKTIREERFKDRFSRKANTIRNSKTTVARVLTELSVRRNKENK
jgi:ribosomal protein L29